MKLLHLDTSITGENSISRQLTAHIVSTLIAQDKSLEITHHDLNREPVNYLSSASFTDENEKAHGAQYLQEFLDADILVIGAPMYNFSVPAQLRSWIDRIAVAGKTFRYTANGSEGLAGGKRVIIASVRGGYYNEESGLAALDHQENYLKTVFGFLGITDVEFIRAEGVATGADNKEKALNAAMSQIATLPSNKASAA